jgi:hypothetical protein
MNAKNKRLGTKAQIRAEKERQRRIGTVIFTALILTIILFSAYFGYTLLSQPQNQTLSQEPSQPKAAIVDQLSLTFPNQAFIEAATNILKQAGYRVDYYPGEMVTVEFYRKLPTHGYSVIILRVHSGISSVGQDVGFFSSEPYSTTKYVYEQLTDQVAKVSYSNVWPPPKGEPLYFGISPRFVTSSMVGMFNDTTIVVMGCYGLTYTSMAHAFIEKGAKAYIGWNASVSATHTDTATINLLQHLITQKQTIKQAIDNTMKEVGTDPVYNSQLTYYPLKLENKQ